MAMYFVFGMQVVGADGTAAGSLDRVLVDPSSREVSHVVVRSPEVSEEVLLPLNMVQGNTDHELLLYVASGDLTNMPRYYEGRTSSPPAGRVDTAIVREPAARREDLEQALSVPANALELGTETAITTSDGSEGLLAGVMTEQYLNHLSELCLSGLCERDVLISADQIGALHAGAIALKVTCEQVQQASSAPARESGAQESGALDESAERHRADRWQSQHTPAE
jgi:hypothetical protein